MSAAAVITDSQAALEKSLHDLCQPLTTLQCKLELGQMLGDEGSLREAVEGALVECYRMFESITVMRERVLANRKRLGDS